MPALQCLAGPVAPAGQPGQYARMPAHDLAALLPYGLSPDGSLMHITEVPAGLACWCRCPRCGSPLVARKGALVAPHFAHAGGRACKAAWETTLHRLAKEVVRAACELLLPEAVAELDGMREHVAAARVFRCEAIETEVDLGGLRPDAVLHRAGRTLAVEFAVTHFCEPEKVAELRRRGLPCVEVDLSAVPRFATREAHTRAILHEAPRHWLFNARIAGAEARLRAAGQARAEAERARRAGRYARLTEAIIIAWAAPHRPGDPALARWAHHAGLDEIVGLPAVGQEVFAVEPATWQTVLLQLCMTSSGKRRVGVDQVLQGLRERGVLKAPFATARVWDSDLVEQVRARLPDFQPPAAVVSTYCAHLVSCGVLRLGAGGWRADPDTAQDVRARLAAVRSARAREVAVLTRVGAVLAGTGAALPLDWMHRPLAALGGSPAEIAHAGGSRYESLLRRLGALARMVRPGGEPMRGGVLGLPLSELNRVRAEEARLREQQRRQRLAAAQQASASR